MVDLQAVGVLFCFDKGSIEGTNYSKMCLMLAYIFSFVCLFVCICVWIDFVDLT